MIAQRWRFAVPVPPRSPSRLLAVRAPSLADSRSRASPISIVKRQGSPSGPAICWLSVQAGHPPILRAAMGDSSL
ncbi:hypothetical protein LCGC14_1498630 [marine sediment metagenome]|uniref:Uncharacterized protein n=1 Tax=marine sediment metagenome TaxID=412755 RepID=A0A0F9JQL2_9ZZZZ